MRLSSAIADLAAKLAGLQEELGLLQAEVERLEGENEDLRARLYREQLAAGRAGLDNLGNLYGEGYHICPANFAQSRDLSHDCLFCLALLGRSRG